MRPPRCPSVEAAIGPNLWPALLFQELSMLDAGASSEEVQELLGKVAGVHLEGHPTLDAGAAVQALGVFSRLRAGVPTLLVGDFGADEDLALTRLLGEILRAPAAMPVVALDASSGTVAALDALLGAPPGTGGNARGAEERPLVLVRCGRAALEVLDGGRQLAFVDAALFGSGAGGPASRVLASLNYVDASALALQRRLPLRLREAVVCVAPAVGSSTGRAKTLRSSSDSISPR